MCENGEKFPTSPDWPSPDLHSLIDISWFRHVLTLQVALVSQLHYLSASPSIVAFFAPAVYCEWRFLSRVAETSIRSAKRTDYVVRNWRELSSFRLGLFVAELREGVEHAGRFQQSPSPVVDHPGRRRRQAYQIFHPAVVGQTQAEAVLHICWNQVDAATYGGPGRPAGSAEP